MNEQELKAAWKHCRNNSIELGKSETCACFYCRRTFKPSDIKEYIDKGGSTAVCPHCSVDSIIGSEAGYLLTRDFLSEMNKRWFGLATAVERERL